MASHHEGRLFVIDGDVMKVACDAVLIPVDSRLHVTDLWCAYLGLASPGTVPDARPFADNERAQHYRTPKTGPEIWLGDVGRASTVEDGWYADCLRQFAERYSNSARRRAKSTVPPRIAVPVVGSGRGGGRRNKGDLFRTIVPALEAAALEHGVDIVLVCWGPAQYSAAQRIRIEKLTGSGSLTVGDSARLDDVACDLARHARFDQLVLFLGAGVSMGAGMGSWPTLLEALLGRSAKQLDLTRFRQLDLRDQAAIVAKGFASDAEYRDAIVAEFQGAAHYSLAHGLLASLATRENVTTNYDSLFELACTTRGRTCAVLPYEPVTGQSRWLLKLHGSIEQPQDIVLTRDDYLGLPERSGALFGVLQSMLITRHMLFIGYSLKDDTFHQVMHEVRRARRGLSGTMGTAIVLFRDELLEELWGDVLDIVPIVDAVEPVDDPEAFDSAARDLEILLDRVALLSANVSSFILDRTYEQMLTHEEREIVKLLDALMSRAFGAESPIADRLVGALKPIVGPTSDGDTPPSTASHRSRP